jgi:hypothetical protein
MLKKTKSIVITKMLQLKIDKMLNYKDNDANFNEMVGRIINNNLKVFEVFLHLKF